MRPQVADLIVKTVDVGQLRTADVLSQTKSFLGAEKKLVGLEVSKFISYL